MAHSVEGRVPFLDHHVVELVRDLPVAQKIRGMTEKYVLREAARPVLTDTVYGRHKHPFLSPPATFTRRAAARAGAGHAARLGGAAVPFFDQARSCALLDRLPTLEPGEQVAIDQILMLLLSATVLGERFGLAA